MRFTRLTDIGRGAAVAAALILAGFAALHGAVAGGFNPSQLQQSSEADKDLPKNPDFDYLRLDPIFLPLAPDRGETQNITVIVTLELPSGTKDDAREYVPHLNDAYLQSIYDALKSARSPRTKNEVDVEALKKLLTDVTAGIMGKDGFHQVMVKVQAVMK